MTDTRNNSPHSPQDPLQSLDGGALLRVLADSETDILSPAQLDELQKLAASSTDHRVAFERALRDSVTRILGSEDEVQTPDALRAAIGAIQSGASAPATRRPLILRRPVWLGVAAACLALAAMVAGIATDMLKIPGLDLSRFESPEHYRTRLASFLGSEHARCGLSEAALKGKMTQYDLSAAPAKLSRIVGHDIWVPDLTQAGFDFMGSGQCSVPGAGDSVHFLFKEHGAPNPPDARSILSLFVQQDTGLLPLDEGVVYRIKVVTPVPAAVWKRNGLIYYLVPGTDALGAKASEMLKVSTPTSDL